MQRRGLSSYFMLFEDRIASGHLLTTGTLSRRHGLQNKLSRRILTSLDASRCTILERF